MKEFFKKDYFFQLGLVIVLVVWNLGYGIYRNNGFDSAISYHFVVGISQLISFIIRLFMNYRKNLFYKIYGWMLIPVWLTLLLAISFSNFHIELGIFENLAIGAMYWLFLAVFFAPILSIGYLIYCYNCYKNFEKSDFPTRDEFHVQE